MDGYKQNLNMMPVSDNDQQYLVRKVKYGLMLQSVT